MLLGRWPGKVVNVMRFYGRSDSAPRRAGLGEVRETGSGPPASLSPDKYRPVLVRIQTVGVCFGPSPNEPPAGASLRAGGPTPL